jgi:hypothetical protein
MHKIRPIEDPMRKYYILHGLFTSPGVLDQWMPLFTSPGVHACGKRYRNYLRSFFFTPRLRGGGEVVVEKHGRLKAARRKSGGVHSRRPRRETPGLEKRHPFPLPRSRGQKNPTDRVRPWQAVLSVALLAFCLSGCGSGKKVHPVFGTVTYQGKPVAQGMVGFSNPPMGIDIFATIQPDGKYVVQIDKGAGLPEGTYAVAVVPPRIDVPVGAMPTPQPPCPDIPQMYRDASTSRLTLTVKPGENTFDIDMR